MREPHTAVNSWRSEGRNEGFAEGMVIGMLEARRADLLRTYHLRFQSSAPLEVTAAVREIDDLDTLSRWLDAAVTAPNAVVFQASCFTESVSPN